MLVSFRSTSSVVDVAASQPHGEDDLDLGVVAKGRSAEAGLSPEVQGRPGRASIVHHGVAASRRRLRMITNAITTPPTSTIPPMAAPKALPTMAALLLEWLTTGEGGGRGAEGGGDTSMVTASRLISETWADGRPVIVIAWGSQEQVCLAQKEMLGTFHNNQWGTL